MISFRHVILLLCFVPTVLVGQESGALNSDAPIVGDSRPKLLAIFSDDFSKDSRHNYKVTGEVEWESQRLTLKSGSYIERDADTGSWVKVNLDVDWFAPSTTQTTSELDIHLDLDVVTDCLVRLNVSRQDGIIHSRLSVYRIPQNGDQPIEEMVRTVTARDTHLDDVTVEYRNGMLTVSPKNRSAMLMAYIRTNGSAPVDRISLASKSTLGIRRFEVDASSRAGTLSAVQREKLTRATQLAAEFGTLYRAGRFDKALQVAKEARDIRQRVLGKGHPQYATSLNNLAALHFSKGDFQRAEALFQESLDIYKGIYGEKHPEYATSLVNLAAMYNVMKEYGRAEPLFRQSVENLKRVVGEKDPDYALSLHHLASLYYNLGAFDRAEPLLRETLEIDGKAIGTAHPQYAAVAANLARLYERTGDYSQAKLLYEKSLSITQKARGKSHPEYAACLNRLAKLYSRLNDQIRAEELCRQALEINRDVLGERHTQYADNVATLASIYESTGDYPQAERLMRKAVRIEADARGENRLEFANKLTDLARLYANMRVYDRAEPLYRKALATREKLLGASHPKCATSLIDLASLYDEMGDYSRAEQLGRQASDTLKKILGAEHPDYVASLHCLAEIYWHMGDYDRAKSRLEDVLQVYKSKTEKHPLHVATSLNNLAALYLHLGDLSKAESLFQQALETVKEELGDMHPQYASNLNNLANVYVRMGDYPRAEPLCQQALKIYEQVPDQEHPHYVGASMNTLAELYDQMGAHETAEPLYRRAVEVCKDVLGDSHPLYAVSLHNLAGAYMSQGEYGQARQLVELALEIDKRVLGETHPQYATGLGNLAFVIDKSGDQVRAESLFKQTLELTKRALSESHPDYAVSVNNLAALYVEKGDYASAAPLFQRALEIQNKSLGATHPAYADTLNNLASLHQRTGNGTLALPLLQECLQISKQHVERSAVLLSEVQQRSFTERMKHRLYAYLSVCQQLGEHAADAFTQSADWKGSTLMRQRAYREVASNANTAGLFKELRAIASQINHHFHQDPTHRSWAQRLSDLNESKASLEKQLALRSATFRQTQIRVTPESILTAIPKDHAFVDLSQYMHFSFDGESFVEQRFIAFVLRHDAPIKMVDLGSAESIVRIIDKWRLYLSGNSSSNSQHAEGAAHEMRSTIWLPIERELGSIKHIVVCPDGALGRIPFGAIPGREPDTYLLEEFQFANVTVPRLLPELMREQSQQDDRMRNLLLLGDVDYDAELPGSTKASSDQPRDMPHHRGSWSPLPGTAAEIKLVEQLHRELFGTDRGALRSMTGAEASEELLRKYAPQSTMIHLATHGFFADPSFRSEPLTQEVSNSMSRGSFVLTNNYRFKEFDIYPPGLLSGLVLAGANRVSPDDTEDGIMTADEISFLPLDRTDLVTLSACETGLGKVAGGEGLLGIQRAFQVAGARSVIASLWKVDDNQTEALMGRFYRNYLINGMSKSDSLREAQLSLLNGQSLLVDQLKNGEERGFGATKAQDSSPSQRVHPRYWAAFVLSGDWR